MLLKAETCDFYVSFLVSMFHFKSKRVRDASIYTSKKISLKFLFLSDIFFDVYILASRTRLRISLMFKSQSAKRALMFISSF